MITRILLIIPLVIFIILIILNINNPNKLILYSEIIAATVLSIVLVLSFVIKRKSA